MFSLEIFEVFSTTGWITVILATLIGFLVLRSTLNRPKNFPPGPRGLPFVGYLPFLVKNPVEKLRDLSNNYGDIMGLNICGWNVIHLGSYEAIRDAFVTQGNDFSARPEFELIKSVHPRKFGILFSDGEHWKIHRRFALQTLRDFGFGKLSLEARIQDIAKDVIQTLEESKKKSMNIKSTLTNATTNVICSLLFDHHFKEDDPVFVKLLKNMEGILTLPPLTFVIEPSYYKIFPVKRLSKVKHSLQSSKELIKIMQIFIEEHEKTFDPNFLRDYVDVYLNEMKKREHNENNDGNRFTRDSLSAVAADLLFAGTETTSNTLHWALKLLMFRPEVQKKIHLEIDEVIGRERLPDNKDRLKMPYTEAVINEVMRFSSLTPLGVFRRNPEEVKLRNYTIPKDSFIIPNFWAVHFDPKFWQEPEKFDPNRFLNADGKLKKSGNLSPFSLGKRVCLGETLARTETFIFLTSILQRFNVVPPDGESDPSTECHHGGLIRTLLPYNLCAHKRY